MKMRKIVSLMLTVSVVGSCCACKKTPESESKTTETNTPAPTSATETTRETTETTSETQATSETKFIAKVEDESDDPIVIYGYESDFGELMKTYLPEVEFEYVQLPKDEYFKKLESAMKEEEKTPDLFMCDKEHLQDYSYSNRSIDLKELGIEPSDLSDQFAYTYEAASDSSHEVKALSYSLAPSAILYNRALAYQAFGSDDPGDVMRRVESWDNILETAQDVNLNSEGRVKLLAGISDIRDTFWASHSGRWIKDNKVVIDKDFNKYFHLEEVLMAESLTFEAEYGSVDWEDYITSGNVIMFFGSLLRAAEVIGYTPGHREESGNGENGTNSITDENKKEGQKGNETSESESTSGTSETIPPEVTGWAILPAPEASYDGGIWLMAASTCDMKATAAKILRTLTMNENTMEQMALTGIFVNSQTVMKKCAADPFFTSDFLGGQNPYAVLVPVAERIQVSADTEESTYAFKEIETLLQAYLSGQIATMDEVKQQFTIGLEELFGLTQ